MAAAEMAFAGGLGLTLDLKSVPAEGCTRDDEILFSESASRILLEVSADRAEAFEKAMAGFPTARIGRWETDPVFRMKGLDGKPVIDLPVSRLREAWEGPFRGW